MLKLTKYEFIKSKLTLILTAIVFALLEGYFLYGIIIEDTEHTVVSMALLTFFSLSCVFVVYILAITNYSKELSSKSSYLIFMTPNTALNIILSKMLSSLIIGIGFIVVIGIVFFLDMHLFLVTYESTRNIIEFILTALESMDIDTSLILPTLIVYSLEFIINFFCIVTMIYFAITLSSTVLQNKRGKGLVSFILVIIFAVLLAKIEEYIPHIYDQPKDIAQAVISILPTVAFEFILMICCVFGTAQLLEKKVSL